MKKLIIGLFIISTSIAHASLESAMENRSSDELKKAMNIELAKMNDNSFRCNFDPFLVMGYEGENIKRQVKRVVNLGIMSITVDEYLRNPKPFAQYEVRSIVTSIKFTLSKDSKKVIGIDLLNQKMGSKDVNAGTLLNPQIKTVQTLTTHLEGSCEVDY